MVQTVGSLDWQPIAAQNNEFAAIVSVDSAVDTLWRVIVNGAPNDAPDGSPVLPNYMVIDNLANNGVVDVSYGPLIFAIPQYTRKTFPLPQSVIQVTILATVGVVNVAFVQSQYAPDDSNLFAINQASAPTVLFPHKNYAVTANQGSSDQNTYTEFAPVAADTIYNLIAAGISPLQDGWLQFVKNSGSKKVSLRPAGIDTINGIFTNAAPMIMSPGDSGILQFDGAEWNFQGHLSFLAPGIAIANAANGILLHGLGIIPQLVQQYMQCVVANNGWSVGDILYETGPVGLLVTSTALSYMLLNPWLGSVGFVNHATGAGFGMSAGQWNIVFRADAYF